MTDFLEDMDRESRALAEQAARMSKVVGAVRRLVSDLDGTGVTLAVERTATMVEVSIGVAAAVADCRPAPDPEPAQDSRPWIGAPYVPGPDWPEPVTITTEPDPSVVLVNEDATASRETDEGAGTPPSAAAPNARDGGAGGQATAEDGEQGPPQPLEGAAVAKIHTPDAANPNGAHLLNAWTREEDEIARRVLREGGTQADVYGALGGRRSASACKTKCMRLRKEMASEAPTSAESQAAPTPAPQPTPVGSEAESQQDTAPPLETRTVGGAWTEDEDDALTGIILSGGNAAAAVAEFPSRSRASVEFRFYATKRKLREQTGSEPAQAGEQSAEDGPKEAAPATAPEAEKVRLNLSRAPEFGTSVGRVDLPKLHGPWTRELDLDLIQTLTEGKMRLAAWAWKNGVEIEPAKKRFWAYCGNPPSYDAQTRAIRALKAIVEPVAAE